MKFMKRSNRRLPSPLELSIYLCAVIVFCVVNWTLLKAVNPDKPPQKSFESIVLENMLENLPPVSLPNDSMMLMDMGNFSSSSEHTLRLEPWMLSYESFFLFNTEREIVLEDWMIDVSTWIAQ
jgi:hypothetical protein